MLLTAMGIWKKQSPLKRSLYCLSSGVSRPYFHGFAKYSVVFMKDVDKGDHWIHLLKHTQFLCHTLPHAIQLFPLITVLKIFLFSYCFQGQGLSLVNVHRTLWNPQVAPFPWDFSIPLHQINSLCTGETKWGKWILAWVISERLLSSH